MWLPLLSFPTPLLPFYIVLLLVTLLVMHLIFVFSEGGRRSLDARRGKMIFRATWWARLWGESALRTMCFTRSPGPSWGSPGPTGHKLGVSWQTCLLPWLPRWLRHMGQSWTGG